MRLTKKIALLAACLATIAVTVGAAPPAGDDAALERGRTLTQAFYRGELEAIAADFSAQASAAIGGLDGLAAFRQQVLEQLGEEVEVLDEVVGEQQGATVYTRTSVFDGFEGPVVVIWAFGPDGAIVGFAVQSSQPTTEAASRFLDYDTKAQLRLPFDGAWTVFWGGRSVEQNYHAAYTDQRFAYDFVVMRGGSTYSGEGSSNEEYHCFGLPILAPGDGVVVAVENSVPDNEPSVFDAEDPLGNHVIIDHGHAEFSFLAHLRQGSVVVEPGMPLQAGDVIGKCGNSGRSSEPHLHYHLQNSAEPLAGEGLPAQFQGYLADGEPVIRGEPLQGQTVERCASCDE